MPRPRAIALCLAAATLYAPAQTAPPLPLADQITQVLSAADVARDHWGIYVTTLDGQPVYALNEGQLFQPASNTKLFTTAAALALLGPDHRLITRITGALDPGTGIVKGDLTLIGAGDANLDSEDLPYVPPAARPKPDPKHPVPHQPNPMRDINDLVSQLVAKGVKQVDGDIVGDDALFPWDPYPESWSIDDAVWGYGAPVSALTIEDNELRLEIAAGVAAGQLATVTLEQAVPYYSIQNETQTVAAKAQATGVQVVRSIGSRTLRLFGSIALKDEPDVEHVAIEDPAEYAAMVLRAALLEHGITVNGNTRAKHQQPRDAHGFLTALHAPNGEELTVAGGERGGNCMMPGGPETVLASHESAPLLQDVVLTNKVSQNLHAELFLHTLGRRVFCGDGSTVAGARIVRAFLLRAGIDAGDFVFFDGSGLSNHDLVTPRATAKLLSFAATQPWFAGWKASLPIAGEDGSLAQRFKNLPIKDRVFAKTGTLGEARALSGYAEADSGRTLIFSIMVGDHLPGTSADRDAMDRIVAAVQATE